MFRDNLPHRVSIYRKVGFEDYDFTDSEEGAGTDDWVLIALDARARFEPEDTPMQRRSDGIADIGEHKFYVEGTTDIQNADRVLWVNSESGMDFLEVLQVVYIRDRFNRIHHKEIKCSHIDWTPPVSMILAS